MVLKAVNLYSMLILFSLPALIMSMEISSGKVNRFSIIIITINVYVGMPKNVIKILKISGELTCLKPNIIIHVNFAG